MTFDPCEIRVENYHFDLIEIENRINSDDIIITKTIDIDNSLKSKLIESILTRIPIGIIYVEMNQNGQLEIFDGNCRINIIHDFFNNKFKLQNMDILTQFENFTFNELPRNMQRRIEEYTMHYELIDYKFQEEIAENIKEKMLTKFS